MISIDFKYYLHNVFKGKVLAVIGYMKTEKKPDKHHMTSAHFKKIRTHCCQYGNRVNVNVMA